MKEIKNQNFTNRPIWRGMEYDIYINLFAYCVTAPYGSYV